MSPVTPRDHHEQLLDAYLEYLRNYDRASTHQHEYVRLHVLPALSKLLPLTNGVHAAQVLAAPAPAVLTQTDAVGDSLVKRDDLESLCDQWNQWKVLTGDYDYVPRNHYMQKTVEFARLVGKLACCLNLHLSEPVTFSGKLERNVDDWVWSYQLYKARNMYKKFTGSNQRKTTSSTKAFVRMFKECMAFGEECKTDPECLAIQRQLDEITRDAMKLSRMS